MEDDEGGGNLSPSELRALFLMVCRALSCDALRMKPREKQFCLLLALESLCQGSDSGEIGVSHPVRGVAQTGYWCGRLSDWRPSEIWEMLQNWRRAGWVAVDEAEGRFRLAPDRLPGWADVNRLLATYRQQPADLATDEDLHKTVARFSQVNAIKSQPAPVAEISQPRGAVPNVLETFNRFTSERINVPNVERPMASIGEGDCENFAIQLMGLVRKFVGEADWTNDKFWNAGKGWRRRLFTEEGETLKAAIDYCEHGLATGETRLKKTKGALLWNEFQRRRQAEARV